MTGSIQARWDKVYGSKAITDVSWYEAQPARSLELIRVTGARSTDPIIDVGSGASLLVDGLLEHGYLDLTVLDISAEALPSHHCRDNATVVSHQRDGGVEWVRHRII